MDRETNSESDQKESIDYSAFGRKSLVDSLVGQINDHLDDDSSSIEPSLVVRHPWGENPSVNRS